MISTEVEARATLPTYMTYPDTWRTKQQPPEFLRPAPKPLTQLRYNGISTALINGLTNTHHSQQQQQHSSPPTVSGGRVAPCLPPQPNLPPTPSPSPSTPTTPSSVNPLRNSCKYSPPILVGGNNHQQQRGSSSPVNLSAAHKLVDEPPVVAVPPQVQMTADDLQYTAYRIFAPSFVPSPYHASPYAVYAAAAAAAASPYGLLPPHHAAAPRTTAYIPTTTVAPPLSPLIDPTTYNSLTTASGTYLSPTTNSHAQHKDSIHPLGAVHQSQPPPIAASGPGGSITSGTSAKANVVGGSITSGTSLLRERRPPGVASAGGGSQFKIPSGKEGSLKHRILQTRPDEQVLDLQHKGAGEMMRGDGSNIGRKRICATLSPPPPTLAPPPITSLPPKQSHTLSNLTSQVPHIPYPIQSKPHAHTTLAQPTNIPHKHLPHHQQHIYSSISPPSSASIPPPGSNGVKQQQHHQQQQQPIITGGSFTRGTFIQLGGGELRRVEDMRTEDFVLSAERNPALRLAESTVVKITENRVTGGAMVTLSYNERRTQVTQIEVESSWEHPYFVMGAGWASCKPELTYQYYGLRVCRLQVGDVLVSVTPREPVSPDIPCAQQPNTPTNMAIKRERDRHSVTPPSNNQANTSNVNNYNSHFRSPNSHQNCIYTAYATASVPSSTTYQQHSLLLKNGLAPHALLGPLQGNPVGMGNTTITTVTGTAMTSRPVTYAHPQQSLVVRSAHAHHTHSTAQHQLPVAVAPAHSGGSRNSRSMSPDSLARKRRWSVQDQLSDDEQQPINRRSKTE